MSTLPHISELAQCLKDEFGDRTFQRGTNYASRSRATVVQNQPGYLTGVVQGSNYEQYHSTVSWARVGHRIDVKAECSCPVGYRCKHAVALILTAQRQSPPSPVASTWRQALSGLVNTTAPDGDESRLGLEIVLTVAHARHGQTTGPMLLVRPVRLGRNDKWVKTGATWRDLSQYAVFRSYRSTPRLNSDQASVLGAMAASAQMTYYSEPGPVPLERFGPTLWFHLRQAVDTGIVFLESDAFPAGAALSATAATAHLDVVANQFQPGSLDVAAHLSVDGERVELTPGGFQFLGNPAHGLAMLEGQCLRLIPLDAPLHTDLTRLFGGPPLVVPAQESDEFLDVYRPVLARQVAIGSSDGSVATAGPTFDRLVLIVERTDPDTTLLIWRARYRRGDRVSDLPLNSPNRFATPSRDLAAEDLAVKQLDLPVTLPAPLDPYLLQDLVDHRGRPADIAVQGLDTVAVFDLVVPWLESRGSVAVEVVGGLPRPSEPTADPLFSLSVSEPMNPPGGPALDGTDWFDLQIEVSVDGEAVDFASLFAALVQEQEVLFLTSGSWLRLDRPELAKLRELLLEARGLADPTGSEVARLNPFQISWWDELTKFGVVETQSARWESNVARMRALSAPEPVSVPTGLQAELRHYQRDGLDWLAFLHRNRLGGILADDMGLGKTVQILALCLHALKANGAARFLVIAPTSVVENWHREARHFAPELRVVTITETEKRRGTTLDEAVGEAQLVVTSYALFRMEFDQYQDFAWEMLLMDEAQFVKNRTSKIYQCVRRLDANTKIAITGTPLENSLMDLWSLLSITAPGLYPDPKRFSDVYRIPIEAGRGAEHLATLRERIAPLMRRRTKDQVLAELPPKIEQTIEVELNPRHARLYQAQLQRVRKKVLGLVDDVQRNRFEILTSLTLLRQLALDPALVDDSHDSVGSAKLDRLIDDLTQVVAEGHKALVFSQFTGFLARVRSRLDEAAIDHSYLDGRTRKRAEAIAAFKDGDVPVFVISLKAGGFGLNLTEADYCFVLDPWWNPAVETQAVDRAHRMGQTNPVVVYRYVSSGTIEEKVMELKARKSDLFSRVLDGEDGALSGPLSADDIRGLLDLAE